GEIVISVQLHKKLKKTAVLEFSVRDTGIGMTEEQMANLFVPFTQGESPANRKQSGAGLGLSIVKRLVEMMSGNIWVDSKKDSGSTFTFTVTLGLHEVPLTTFVLPNELQGMKVLVVDDNATTRTIFLDTLRSFSLNPKVVDSGAAAISELERTLSNSAEKQPYGLVLIDWKMPGIDGFETAKRIKDNAHFADIPLVIMFTAYRRNDIKNKAIELGVNGFLMKPILPNMLYKTIVESAGRHKFIVDTKHTFVVAKDRVYERLAGLRALVVEPHIINQRIICEFLENAKILVEVANKGADAVYIVQNNPKYDIIVMAIDMPDLDGYEVAKIIRRKTNYKDVPIVGLTDHAFNEIDKHFGSGINYYVSKPVDIEQLYNVLLRLIKGSSYAGAIQRTKARESSIIEGLHGIDFATMLKTLATNTELLKTFLVRFQEHCLLVAEDIRKSLEVGDVKVAKDVFYVFKTVCGNISIKELYNLFKKLENTIIENKDDIVDGIEYLLKQLTNVSDKLEYYNHEIALTKQVPMVKNDKTLYAVDELIELLKCNDLYAIKIFKDIKPMLINTGFSGNVEMLEGRLSNFDFSGAIDIINSFKNNISLNPIIDGKHRELQKVFIADDSTINIQILNAALEFEYRVSFATKGKEALELVKLIVPDIILLDVMMPEIDGYELCRKIKADNLLKNIPVILITSSIESESETKGLEAGAVDYVTKPFNPTVVHLRIKNHLELKRQRDMLTRLSTLDGLTGIANRRTFDEYFEREWRRAVRLQKPLSIIMIDIDFFKQYNDTYGHVAGDECLKKVANAIASTLKRPLDLAARYGGEEFVCLLPETDKDGAVFISENLHLNVNSMNIPHDKSSVSKHVTISIGAATAKISNQQTIMEAADKMLYESKHTGRNKFTHTLIE
ncbi:MAG: response regulator, partial [Candidatus Magnetoovum sp. WYHC-5]|nr:response regulator [Candidatus Magnetoovum sp. WYHC-5]